MSEIESLNEELASFKRREMSFSSTLAVVLKIDYADQSDFRVSSSSSLTPSSYGSPTATVFSPATNTKLSGVRILQHGSAVSNMSIWTPTVSTHRELSNGSILAPRRDDLGELVEPIEFTMPANLEAFDGDIVVVQNLPTGEGRYISVITGSIPKSTVSFERLHLDPFSRNRADIASTIPDFEPAGHQEDLALEVRSNNASGDTFRHPSVAVSTAVSPPEKTADQSTEEYIQSSYDVGVLDRTQSNPIGQERYVAHNGTIVRIDQQGSIIVDTSLAGVQNSQIDAVPSALIGDAGHIDINVLKRSGQGLNFRIGGEVVFRVSATISGDVIVSLGKEVAKAFSAVLGENLQKVFDNHQHMTPQGATTKPLPVQLEAFAGEFADEPVPTLVSTNINTANKTSDRVFSRDIILRDD